MKRTAEAYLNVWRSWLGYSESNGKHRKIIDLYNSKRPLPRNYKVTYKDAWCDVTVSAAAIQAGMTDLIGRECGCEEHIKLFKKKGIWIEDGTITPKPGYLIVYNWNATAQPNDGYADHIGVVEKVSGNTITCIEGNKNNSVERRTLPRGWPYIRGYAAPHYDPPASQESEIGSTLIPETGSTLIPETGSTSNSESDSIPNTPSDSTSDSTSNSTSHPEVYPSPSPLNKIPKRTGTVTVKYTPLNIRTWPGTKYPTCTFSPLPNGTKISICDTLQDEKGEDWYYITHKGRYGFAHSAYIK